MPSEIENLWRRLKLALGNLAPEVLTSLSGPAKPTLVAELEDEFGEALPSALKQLWAMHDGQDFDGGSNGLFADFPLFGVADVRQERKEMRELAETMGTLHDADDFVAWHSMVADRVGVISGPVKARDFQPKWLPIGSVNGDVFRYLDFDPAPGGIVGQVIEVDPECVSWRVLAPSFEDFLERYVDALEAGNINWDDPGRGSSSLFSYDKKVPAYLKAHAPKKMSKTKASSSPTALKALSAGETLELPVRVSLLIGGDGELSIRMDLADGERIWADATSAKTRGYKQITMGTRGVVVLRRLPGKKVAYAVDAFAKRK